MAFLPPLSFPRRLARGAMLAITAAMLILPFPGLFEASLVQLITAPDDAFSWRLTAHYARARELVRADPQSSITLIAGRPWLDVMTLSFLASGLMSSDVRLARQDQDEGQRDEIRSLIRVIASRAVAADLSPYRADLRVVTDYSDQGLYLSHVDVILGIHHLLTGEDAYPGLHERVSTYLAERSLADGDFHMRSGPGTPKWSADQSVTLAALALYDRAHHTSISPGPVAGWLRTVGSGLHPSAVTDDVWYHSIPRGCALSWESFWMAQFAPSEGAELYEQYRDVYWDHEFGVDGFREWPPGQTYGMTRDSGPIILGIGMGATALGLAPASIYHDDRAWSGILQDSLITGLPIGVGTRRYLVAPQLAEAILFHGVAATFWFEKPPSLKTTSTPDRPWLAWALLCADLLGIGACLRSLQLRFTRVQRPDDFEN